jgi:peptidoglycan pentaglycine glycine transferase (the first glycine)
MMREKAAGEQKAEYLRRWTAWNEFLESKTDTGFLQSSWWADLRVPCGWGHFGVVHRDEETIVGGAVVMTCSFAPEKCFYYIPEGPVLPESESDAEQVFRKTMEFIEKKRQNEQQVVSHLRIEPRWERVPGFVRGFQEADENLEPRDTLCIDLNPSESALLARMKPKGRYNIGVARRHGVSVVEDVSPQGIEDFLDIYGEMVARQDLGEKDPDYFRALIPALSALQRGSLFFAEYQGMRLATALVVYFGRRATYLHGASRAIHREVMAPYLLHFEIMRKAKALGFATYDLWGVAPQSEPHHPWTNFSVFKRKLGGRELNLVPTLDYIYDPAAYEDFRSD